MKILKLYVLLYFAVGDEEYRACLDGWTRGNKKCFKLLRRRQLGVLVFYFIYRYHILRSIFEKKFTAFAI